jgi:hypothetical protein
MFIIALANGNPGYARLAGNVLRVVNKMAFEKGKEKTGGRVKGGSFRTSKKFMDQLHRYGLNVAKELANGIMAIPDPILRFNELRRLLPYLLPELKPIDMKELEDDANNPESPFSDADLLSALSNGRKQEPDKPVANPVPAVETRSADVQAPASSEADISDMDGEQEDN